MQNLKRNSWPYGHFSTIDNLLDGLNPFKISEKLPGCQYSMNFLSISVAFYSFIRSVDLWLIVCFVLGLGYCPMSDVLCGVFLKLMCQPFLYPLVHVVAWACLESTGWSIKFLWLVFVVVVFFFYLCSTCIFGFGYVVGRGGEGGEGRGGRVLGVNIVKCRNATT